MSDQTNSDFLSDEGERLERNAEQAADNAAEALPVRDDVPTDPIAVAALENMKAEEEAKAADPLGPIGDGLIVHPLSGGVLKEDDPTDVLCQALMDHRDILDALAGWKLTVERELIRRLDAANTRKEQIGNYQLETNAPRSESYTVEGVREALQPLVDSGQLDAVVLERVITTPTPKPPPTPTPRIAKVEVNKLKKHPEQAVRDAIDAACEELDNARSLKIVQVR